MTDDQKKYEIYQNSLQLRGAILEGTVNIERLIDDYLSNYFCDDNSKGNELKEMLWHTERINLSGKKDVLFILLNRYEKDFLKKHSTFVDKLERLIPHRNIFAHLEMDYNDIDEMYISKKIAFRKYKNGKLDLRSYGPEEITALQNDFVIVMNALKELKPAKPPQTSTVATD